MYYIHNMPLNMTFDFVLSLNYKNNPTNGLYITGVAEKTWYHSRL